MLYPFSSAARELRLLDQRCLKAENNPDGTKTYSYKLDEASLANLQHWYDMHYDEELADIWSRTSATRDQPKPRPEPISEQKKFLDGILEYEDD